MIEPLFRRPEMISYSQKDVLSLLELGLPVYISGRTYIDKNQTITDGHSWLIDGFCKQKRTVTEKEGTFPNYIYNTSTEERLLFHCNFGWTANCDGYYIADVFNLTNGPLFQHEIDKNENNKNKLGCNFNVYLRMIHYYGIY